MTTLIATFPKIHLEHFQVFVTCTSTLPLSMQPRQPCFCRYHWNRDSHVFAVIIATETRQPCF